MSRIEKENIFNLSTISRKAIQTMSEYARCLSDKIRTFDAYNRIFENIISIRWAVGRGNHSTLYYPGHGRDLLRAAIAYDASHIVGVDPLLRVKERNIIQKGLQELGLQFA